MKFIPLIVAYILLSLFVYTMQKSNADALATITHGYKNSVYLIEGASYAAFPFIQHVIFSIFFVVLLIMSWLLKNFVLMSAVFSCTLAFVTLLIISLCCHSSEDFFQLCTLGVVSWIPPLSINIIFHSVYACFSKRET